MQRKKSLLEVVRKLNTEKLIEFLREEEDLQLDEDDFKILRDEKIIPQIDQGRKT